MSTTKDTKQKEKIEETIHVRLKDDVGQHQLDDKTLLDPGEDAHIRISVVKAFEDKFIILGKS